MIVINARNVNDALPQAVALLLTNGRREETRNGPAVVGPEPVTISYRRPQERVLFAPERDHNPFFAVAESLWMLAGRDDVEFPAFFVRRMREYSDNGSELWGAYGHRWRRRFGFDQVDSVIEELRECPESRRAALQMWGAEHDLRRQGLDIPCNLIAHFQVRDGELEMLVAQRSGDAIWGALGTNQVHFGFLMEYVAGALGLPLGAYRHVVSNFHAYLGPLEQCREVAGQVPRDYPASPYPLGVADDSCEGFDEECGAFCDWEPKESFRLPFFREVAVPLRDAYAAYKATPKPEAFASARSILNMMAQCDWRLAAEQWIERREERWEAKRQAGRKEGKA